MHKFLRYIVRYIPRIQLMNFTIRGTLGTFRQLSRLINTS